MSRHRGGGGGGGAGIRGLNKTQAFFESIRTENTKTLSYSLRGGGFSPTKPFDNETQLPPIHLAVTVRKIKSLKCMLEMIDRLRGSENIVDFREHEHGMTPLMLAASTGWKEGCHELLRFEASLTAVDEYGNNAMALAKKNQQKGVIKLLQDWGKEDVEVVETEGMKLKRQAREASDAKRAEAAQLVEAANIAANDAKFDERDRVEDAQKEAMALSKWDEVKEALDSMSAEVRVAREDDESAASIDPTLWSIETLKILRLRLPKPVITVLPSDLGRLVNLTELIVSHNSLTTLPVEVGLLIHLKALEAESNCLESLPKELGNCAKMEVINVTANKLKSLEPLGTMPELKSVYASNNELEQLDFPIEILTHLRVLAVSGNVLAALPAGIGELQQMIHLDASDNALTDLPAEMGNLSEKKLVELELGGNKFKDRKIKQLIEKSVKLVKELTAHLTKQGGGGGGGKGKKGKKNPNKK